MDNKPKEYFTSARPEMLEFIPETAKKILDAGCGAGEFASTIKKRAECEVWGFELNENQANDAGKKIDKVICGDIEAKSSEVPDKYFDCIIFNDVLEHLKDPYSLLEKAKEKLTPGGCVVSSIPNVRYHKTLKGILFKKDFKYTDSGVMDRTHLRFFTKKSIIEMFEKAGYKVEMIKGLQKSKNVGLHLLNILTLGALSDTFYLQYAITAKPKQ